MDILFLDDDVKTFKPFENDVRKILGDSGHITFVSNLVDFDNQLYESGKVFDRYVIDLGIIKPNEFSDDMYDGWLKDNGIYVETILNNIIAVPGWDYFDQVMRKREATRDRLERVLLKTGYADSLISEKGKNCCQPATLLNKGDEYYIEKLKAFLRG